MRIENLLREEIQSEFEGLKGKNLGTEQHKGAVDTLTRLIDRAIEIEKIEADMKAKEVEMTLKELQMKEEKQDRLVKNIIAVTGIIVPVGVTIWGTLASFKFEEQGSVTTIMGRGFINKLLPKK